MSTAIKAHPLHELTYIKGTPLDLDSHLGKKLFAIEFWATWCSPCKTTIPHMTELAHKFKDQVEFIGITNETDESQVKSFVDDMGAQMDYTVAMDKTGSVSSAYMSPFGVSGIPHVFVVDYDGNIAFHDHPSESGFEDILTKLVAGGGNSHKATTIAHHYTLEQISTMSEDELVHLSAKDLRGICQEYGVDTTSCLEKPDYVEAIRNSVH